MIHLAIYVPYLLFALVVVFAIYAGNVNRHAWLIAFFGLIIWLVYLVVYKFDEISLAMALVLLIVCVRNHFRWNVPTK